MRGRTDHETLQAITESEKKRCQQYRRQIGIEAKQRVGEECREQRRGQQRAVGEIDDMQHAIDQRQPERDKGIDRPGHQAVQHRGNEDDRRQHDGTTRRHPRHRASRRLHRARGIGNTGLALANAAGKITLMSRSSTCVLTGAAPWFWPLTNFVGP